MLKTWIAKCMKCLLVGVGGTLVVSGPACAWERLPKIGAAQVLHLVPRNAPITVPEGGQGFYFVTRIPIDTSQIPGCPASTVTFLVPKTDPADPTNMKDNPAYRDSVDVLMLAYSQYKPIAIYVDSCVNGYPRVVGLDVLGSL